MLSTPKALPPKRAKTDFLKKIKCRIDCGAEELMKHQKPSDRQIKTPKEYPYLPALIVALMTLSVGMMALAAWSYFHSPVTETAVTINDKGKASGRTSAPDYREIPAATVTDRGNAVSPEGPHTFSRLREEVDNLLLNQRNPNDSGSAELAGKLLIMSNVNRELEAENMRLREQLGKQGALPSGVEGNGLQLLKPEDQPKLSVDEVQFSAFSAISNVEMETGRAGETEKIGGSFRISNTGSRQSVAEIVVVVIQPDGTVLKNPGTETGIFYTGQTRRECSGKMRLTQQAGESRRINFSFLAPRFSTGKYLLEIYHNGVLIGQSGKTLI
jgi:hypothetical protein